MRYTSILLSYYDTIVVNCCRQVTDERICVLVNYIIRYKHVLKSTLYSLQLYIYVHNVSVKSLKTVDLGGSC